MTYGKLFVIVVIYHITLNILIIINFNIEKMKKHLLTLFLIFFIAYSSNAQMNEYFNDIKATFKIDKQKNLVGIAENIKNAETKDADAQQKFTSGDSSKGLSESKKVAKIYSENYRTLFLMYEDKLKLISKDVEGDKAEYVTYLNNEAKNSFRKSISERLEALKEDKEKLAFELLNSAHKNEQDAIDFQSRAFGVINGWIKEDFKIDHPSYKCDEVFDNSTTDNFKVKDFTETELSKPDNYTFNKAVVNTENEENVNVENSLNNNSEIENSDNTNIENSYSDNTNNENSNYSTTGTEYRIQIGVSILPATESQIKRLNSTDLEVKTYKSKVYYKYTIGQFASYQEAKSYKNAYGLAKTYITEYKNGKEVKFYFKDI